MSKVHFQDSYYLEISIFIKNATELKFNKLFYTELYRINSFFIFLYIFHAFDFIFK